MNGSELVSMYEFSYMAINRNLDGVTHEESLFIPEPAGNCINWGRGPHRRRPQYRANPGGWQSGPDGRRCRTLSARVRSNSPRRQGA